MARFGRLGVALALVVTSSCIPFLDTSPIEAAGAAEDTLSDVPDAAADISPDSADTALDADVEPERGDPCLTDTSWCDPLGRLRVTCDIFPVIENCTFGCEDGECRETCEVPSGCNPEGNSVLECDGAVPEPAEQCNDGEACVGGGCRDTGACEPGGSSCNVAGDLVLCDETGADNVTVTCPGATCIEVWRDSDEDGWGDAASGVRHACELPASTADNPHDCDDTVATEPTSPCAGFVLVQGGSFLMGTPPGESDPIPPAEVNRQMVEITRDLLVMETEVTQELWETQTLEATNPAFNQGCPMCPVERVSWFEALKFANQVSEAAGLPVCYELSECSGVFTGGCEPDDEFCSGYSCDNVTFEGFDCTGFRLPSEAEWEYFTRAGSTGPFGGRVEELAWFRTNLETLESQPVGGLLPNAWGLYDVHGNVGEWVMDVVDGPYATSEETQVDPLPFGEVEDVSELTPRGVRGGGFNSSESAIRAASRGQSIPGDRVHLVGLRLVRTFDAETGN